MTDEEAENLLEKAPESVRKTLQQVAQLQDLSMREVLEQVISLGKFLQAERLLD